MSTILERMQYGFDRDSRRTWRRRALTSGQDNSYGYDGLSQVTNAALGTLNLNATAIGGVPAVAEAWDYDPSGNWRGYRVEADGSVSLDQSRVHDKGNRLTQVVGDPNPVVLDPVGRMLEVSPDAAGDWENSQQITWDAWSRVTQVTDGSGTTVLGSYSYDGLSRRGTRTVGDTITHCYYSDAWRPLEERTNDETTPSMQYYWGARHRDDLVRRDRATTDGGSLDESRYVLMDYFSPAALTDESGTVTERYAFSAFGVRQILAPDFSPRSDSECAFEFAFQGQFLDSESGFMDYGYRYYSPYLGRWLSRDPIGERGGINLYGYVLNRPTQLVDLFGLDDINGFAAGDPAGANVGEGKTNDPFPNSFTIALHGKDGVGYMGLADGKSLQGMQIPLTAQQLLDAARGQGYKPGGPMMLTVCQSAATNPSNGTNLARDLSLINGGGPVTGYSGDVKRIQNPPGWINPVTGAGSSSYYNQPVGNSQPVTYQNGIIVPTPTSNK